MFAKVITNNMFVVLTLYQLTVTDPTSVGKVRLYKLLLELIGVLYGYYYLCHCSEALDDAQRRVTIAVASSHWFKCSSATRRKVCMLLMRTQKPNHLKFHQGIIVLSRAYFWSVAKLSYSFVNFMKISTSD
ncbi:hypothetical protein WDU94_004964 [Cyamophila willieti]